MTYRAGSETKRCAVGPGFAEAGPDKLVLLTDEFTEREGIDPVLVRKELGEVQKELQKLEAVPLVAADAKGADAAAATTRAQREVLIARENWAAAQLELYGDPPPPRRSGPTSSSGRRGLPRRTRSRSTTTRSQRTGKSKKRPCRRAWRRS